MSARLSQTMERLSKMELSSAKTKMRGWVSWVTSPRSAPPGGPARPRFESDEAFAPCGHLSRDSSFDNGHTSSTTPTNMDGVRSRLNSISEDSHDEAVALQKAFEGFDNKLLSEEKCQEREHHLIRCSHVDPFEQNMSPCLVEMRDTMVRDAEMQEPVVDLLTVLLDATVCRNDKEGRKSSLEDFEKEWVPMKASAYIKRMLKYGGCSPCCVVVALIYIQRLKQRHIAVSITSRNIQRLLLVAVLLATKYLDDQSYTNEHWAEIGGISNKELNHLELLLLVQLQFSLHVKREEYDAYLCSLGNVSCKAADAVRQ